MDSNPASTSTSKWIVHMDDCPTRRSLNVDLDVYPPPDGYWSLFAKNQKTRLAVVSYFIKWLCVDVVKMPVRQVDLSLP